MTCSALQWRAARPPQLSQNSTITFPSSSSFELWTKLCALQMTLVKSRLIFRRSLIVASTILYAFIKSKPDVCRYVEKELVLLIIRKYTKAIRIVLYDVKWSRRFLAFERVVPWSFSDRHFIYTIKVISRIILLLTIRLSKRIWNKYLLKGH